MKKLNKFLPAILAACLLTGCAGQTGTVSSNKITGNILDSIETGYGSINPDDYIELGQYKGLKVSRISSEVTDEDVEAEFKESIEYLLTPTEITDRDTVEEGDIVNIDFLGKIDGEAFEGGAAQGYDLTIGSGQFIEGFEEGLIGIKVGEETSLDLTFPDDYVNDKGLEGKPVVFEVSVNAIKRKPEATDDNVKEATDGKFATISDYKKSLRDSLKEEAIQYADSAMYSDLWEQAVNNAKLLKDIPEGMIKEKVDIMSENAKSYANMYGLDWEGYLSQVIGKTQEEFNSEAAEYAAKAAKESLVLMAITKAENLDLTQEEFDKAAKEYVELYNYGSVEEFLSSVDQDQFREYVLKSKIQEFLADEAVIENE